MFAASMTAKSKSRILVVDDENSVLFTYRMILEEKGYTVDTALTSQEAIELVTSQAYDVVLCDLSLEQNRTGFDVFEKVRGSRPFRVTAQTGRAGECRMDTLAFGKRRPVVRRGTHQRMAEANGCANGR